MQPGLFVSFFECIILSYSTSNGSFCVGPHVSVKRRLSAVNRTRACRVSVLQQDVIHNILVISSTLKTETRVGGAAVMALDVRGEWSICECILDPTVS